MAKRHRPVTMPYLEAGVRYEHFVLGVSLEVLEGEFHIKDTLGMKLAKLFFLSACAFTLGVVIYNLATK